MEDLLVVASGVVFLHRLGGDGHPLLRFLVCTRDAAFLRFQNRIPLRIVIGVDGVEVLGNGSLPGSFRCPSNLHVHLPAVVLGYSVELQVVHAVHVQRAAAYL